MTVFAGAYFCVSADTLINNNNNNTAAVGMFLHICLVCLNWCTAADRSTAGMVFEDDFTIQHMKAHLSIDTQPVCVFLRQTTSPPIRVSRSCLY